jgi:hypothetical protein
MQPRFINPEHSAELVNLYHLARTALPVDVQTPYDRKLWAAREFHKLHPEVTETGAYKALGDLLA